MSARTKARGDCFLAAGRLVLEDPSLTLCHGMVSGQGELEGRRFWHAWCERVDAIELGDVRPDGFPPAVHIDTVVDRSNGRELEMPRGLYYAVGRIADDEVRRYRPDEARVLMLRHMHWGPWEEED